MSTLAAVNETLLDIKGQLVRNNTKLDRVAAVKHKIVDGRWLLAAQHLESWSQLWAPQCKDYLPSLDLIISKLIQAETILASYA